MSTVLASDLQSVFVLNLPLIECIGVCVWCEIGVRIDHRANLLQAPCLLFGPSPFLLTYQQQWTIDISKAGECFSYNTLLLAKMFYNYMGKKVKKTNKQTAFYVNPGFI